MNNNKFVKLLKKLGACRGGLQFVNGFTAEEAYNNCKEPSYMFWCLGKLNLPAKEIVKLACKCGRLSLKYTNDARVGECYRTVEAWCDGKETLKEVRNSAANAADAADAAAADAAAYAAYAAASASASADAAAYAASADAAAYAAYADAAAAYAASAAAYAAAYAAYAAAASRNKMKRQQCNVIRKIVPWSTVKQLLDNV